MPRFVPILILSMAVLSAVVWSAFPIHYWVTTKGRCFRTAHGRNVWAMAFVLALLIDTSIAGSLTRRPSFQESIGQNPEWLIWVAALLWPALAGVGIHRHWLLWCDQHPSDSTTD